MTEVTTFTMPPITTAIPSIEQEDNDVAFKVLNNDNLPISIIGDSIHVNKFDLELVKQKPNGIVIPMRRVNLENQKNITKSNGYLNHPNDNNNRQNLSNSHGNLNHCNSAAKLEVPVQNVQRNSIDRTFTRALDTKLRKLQREEKSNDIKTARKSANADEKTQNGAVNNCTKPRFVTTVKCGQFLEPPPEVAQLLGYKGGLEDDGTMMPGPVQKKQMMYAYASRPRVLDRKQQKEVRAQKEVEVVVPSATAKALSKSTALVATSVVDTGKVTGAGGKSPSDGGEYRHVRGKRDVAGGGITKRLGDVPLPYANLMFERRVVRGSNYAMQPTHTLRWNPNFAYAKLLSQEQGDGESAAARAAEARRRAMARRKAQTQQLRGAQLRLGSPPPVQGRRHETIQTDQYLEELLTNPPMLDICTQTDLFLERPVSPFYVPMKAGIDVDTQIYPGDLFDFDMEVQPILEVLVGKTIEQALIEVLEEEELAALREQQRRFMERRAAETDEMFRLEELEKRLQAEKKRRMADHEHGLSLQNEMEERIAASVLMQGYMADLLPSVLEGLEEDGFLVDNIKQDLDESFMPWLMGEVTQELQEMVSSRDVLTDMVREILENRAEIYRALNQDKPGHVSDEEEGPTLDDIQLKEHLKLHAAMAESIDADIPEKTVI